MYSSNAQPTGTNRPRACPNHVQEHTHVTKTHPHRAPNEPQATACSRPLGSSQPTNHHPGHTHVTGGFVRVERVTAAIAKRETPGPIPNPEVKPFSADGTATERLWESRTPPDKHCRSGATRRVAPLLHFRTVSSPGRASCRRRHSSTTTSRPQRAGGIASPQAGSATEDGVGRHRQPVVPGGAL